MRAAHSDDLGHACAPLARAPARTLRAIPRVAKPPRPPTMLPNPEDMAMLKQFDSSYAGHIDLENVGYGGTPVNDRRYPNETLATALGKAEAMAKLMDRLGYGTFWMAEHHFQPEGTECIPNVMMMALHLSHLTKN